MGESNRLQISGTVVFIGPRRVSPAGVPQRRLTIEHRSRQVEAGIAREAKCRIDVKVAGESLAGQVAGLATGQWVVIEGFLTHAGYKGGETGLVLHAERIGPGDHAAQESQEHT